MNKIIVILCALLFFFIFLFGAGNISAADTYYYVSTTGDDDNDGLTWDRAKLTIQNAVNTADSGDTILVADGTYTESVTVDTSLVIRSENGPINCIVQTPSSSSDVFTITKSNVSIIGLTVKNAIGLDKAGIYLNGESGGRYWINKFCTIENVIATNNYYGIYLRFSSNNNLFNNVINSNFYGIYFFVNNSSNLTGNTISSSDKYGIYFDSSENNELTGNSISNATSANAFSFYFSSPNNDIDTSNTVEGKPVYYLYDKHGTAENPLVYDGNVIGDIGVFWCINSSYIQVKNAILSPHNQTSVRFSGTTNSTIENITANSGEHGISLGSSSNNKLKNNTINSNNNTGLFLVSSSGNELTGNAISGNTYNFYVVGSYNNNIDTTNMVEGKPIYYLYDQDGTAENPLVYDGNEIGDIGMFWCINSSYVQVKNAVLSPHNNYGIFFSGTTNSTIENITANSSEYGIRLSSSSSNALIDNSVNWNNNSGIYLSSSSDNELNGNVVNSNDFGIYLSSSSGNELTGNIMSNNRNDIYNTGTTNTYSSNQFNNNIASKMLTFTDTDPRTKDVNNTVIFGTSAFNLDGTDCDGRTTIATFPSETVTKDSESGNDITGHFTVTKPGTYSLIFTVTDENLNTTKRRMLFFAGDTDTETTKYYFRGIIPIHGQRLGNVYDSKSLLLEPPTSTETGWCARWVQISPEEIPNYPLANLSEIDTYTWYRMFKEDGEGTYIGIERYATYLEISEGQVDEFSSIPLAPVYTWINRNLTDLNWGIDDPQNWYWLSLKLKGPSGCYPYWVTFPTGHTADEASYAEFTYEYATTPAIKSISDENIMILSATADADDTGILNIVLEDLTTSDTSTMNIVLSSPVRIDIAIDAWNTTAPYYKQWTETASEPGITATHTISGFAPNNYYMVTKDRALVGLYLSDASGQITFNADAGSIFAVSDVETISEINNGSDDNSSSNRCFIATTAYGTPMAEEVVTLRNFRNKFLLSNPIGRTFVSIYYKVSPKIADFMSEHPVLRNAVRNTLKPIVWFSRHITE